MMRMMVSLYLMVMCSVLLLLLVQPICWAQQDVAATITTATNGKGCSNSNGDDEHKGLEDITVATAIMMEQDFSKGKNGVEAEALVQHLRNTAGTSQLRQRRVLGHKIKSFFEEQIYPDFRLVGRQMQRDFQTVMQIVPPVVKRKLHSTLGPHVKDIKRQLSMIWYGFSEVSILPLLRGVSEVLGFVAETVEDVADVLAFKGHASITSNNTHKKKAIEGKYSPAVSTPSTTSSNSAAEVQSSPQSSSQEEMDDQLDRLEEEDEVIIEL